MRLQTPGAKTPEHSDEGRAIKLLSGGWTVIVGIAMIVVGFIHSAVALK